MKNNINLDNWLNNNNHLPEIFNNEENKTLLTKAILRKMDIPKKYIEEYQIEDFNKFSFNVLFFIAKCGYVLKKNNHRNDFIKFEDEVNEITIGNENPIKASPELRKWLIRDQDHPFYLPEFLRDFHDSKKFFEVYVRQTQDNTMDKVSGLVYFVDVFLFFLARMGYLIRKNGKKFDYLDLNVLLEENQKNNISIFSNILK